MPREKGRRFLGKASLGLEFHGGQLRGVCVSGKGVGAATELSGEALQQWLGRAGTRIVSAAIPISRSLCVTLDLPFQDERRARRVLPSLLDLKLPFPLEQAAYCFPAVMVEKRAALAVVAREVDVTALLTTLAAEQADPQRLDHEGLALWAGGVRWQQQTLGRVGGNLLVVHVADGRVVLVHGREGAYRAAMECRADEAGTFKRLLATLLGPRGNGAASPADATGQILLCGSSLDDAPDCLAAIEAWGYPVERAPHGALFLAESLARRALNESSGYPCNLRVGGHAHAGSARQGRRSLLAAAVLCWLGAGLLLAVSATLTVLLEQRGSQFSRQLDRQLDQTAGFNITTKGEHALGQVAAAVQDEKDRYEAVARQFTVSPVRHVWEVLEQARQAGLSVAAYSFSASGAIILEGSIGDEGHMDGFRRWLVASGWRVEPDDAAPPEYRIVAARTNPTGRQP